MNYKVQISKNSKSENQLFLLNQQKDLKDYISDVAQLQKLNNLLTDKDRYTYIFDGEKINLFVLLDQKMEVNRLNASECFRTLQKFKIDDISIVSKGTSEMNFSFTEALLLSCYTFNKYKPKVKSFLLNVDLDEHFLSPKELKFLEVCVESNSLAKDLVNEPQSYLNAVQYAKDIEKLGQENDFKVTIYDKKKIESLKMGGILAVNKGSIQEPTFVIMEHKPAQATNKKPIVLVGKGVTYDTGGLSLKPTANSMDIMKCDMGGSATVVGSIFGASRLKIPLHIIGLVSLTDNRPGLDAVAPGDVITMYSGDTVEVLNTDAEGRLVLADALHFAKQYDPEFVFDFATLTGASVAAIGPYASVCMGKGLDDSIKAKLFASADNTYERLVEFPMWSEYGKLLQSDVADYKNIGGPFAGSITAGKFLEIFTQYPWMHFDIAGPSFLRKGTGYKQTGATGEGVRLMLDFFNSY